MLSIGREALYATKSADKGINLLTDAMSQVKQRDKVMNNTLLP